MSNNLSTISKQLLLAIEENKMSIKSIECVIGSIQFSGCGISRLR
jgi:hypothetical protein